MDATKASELLATKYSLESQGYHMAMKINLLIDRMEETEWIRSGAVPQLEAEMEQEFIDGNHDLFPLVKMPGLVDDNGELRITARRSLQALAQSGVLETKGRSSALQYRRRK